MTTKRYILFAGAAYYPEGGAHEFRGFGTVEELKKLYEKNRFAWAKEFNCRSPWGHICDHETMQIVSEATATKGGVLWMDAPTPPPP